MTRQDLPEAARAAQYAQFHIADRLGRHKIIIELKNIGRAAHRIAGGPIDRNAHEIVTGAIDQIAIGVQLEIAAAREIAASCRIRPTAVAQRTNRRR